MNPIYVTRSSMPSLSEYMEEIKSIFDSHLLTNMGPVYKKLQHQLKEYLGVKELSLFINGHMALEMALQALNLKGEVITTPYTFASTTHAIVRNGLIPVFCDIKPDDYTIDPDKMEAMITEKTCAILPVHVYGYICDVEAIDKIAKKYNLKVIYDAAHAFGCTYKGIGIGNFGDISMFSFHATKVFNTIEGGGIVYHDKNLRDSLHILKNFGICSEDNITAVGGNAKLDEFRAAMGICNLRHIDEEIAKRGKVFCHYHDRLRGVPGLQIMQQIKDVKPNYAYYPIYIDPDIFGADRDEIYERLKEKGIYCRRYFYPITNEFNCYAGRFDLGNTPVAKKTSLNILTLPLYADLEFEVVEKICDIILHH